MFVVRVATDEALVFRAFRRLQVAKEWARARCREDAGSHVDVFDLPGIEAEGEAVQALCEGRGKLLVSGEKLVLEGFRQNSSLLAGMGIGTGAGF